MNAQKLTIPCDRDERLHYIKRQFSLAKGPDLEALWAENNHATDGTTQVESEYLEVRAIKT